MDEPSTVRGRRLTRAIHAVGASAMLVVVVAMLAFTQEWHRVHETNLAPLGCAFLPDCHGVAAHGETFVHRGFDHGGVPAFMLLAGMLVMASAAFAHSDLVNAAAALFMVAGWIGVGALVFDLAHLLDRVDRYPAESVFWGAFFGVGVLSVALAILTAVPMARRVRRALRARRRGPTVF